MRITPEEETATTELLSETSLEIMVMSLAELRISDPVLLPR